LIPAIKKGTRYRYYVSRSLIVGTANDKSTGRRIPAANLETLVITKLRSFLADEGAVLNVIREEHVDGATQSRLIGRSVKIAKEIESLTPDRIRAVLMTLISTINIRPDCVERASAFDPTRTCMMLRPPCRESRISTAARLWVRAEKEHVLWRTRFTISLLRARSAAIAMPSRLSRICAG